MVPSISLKSKCTPIEYEPYERMWGESVCLGRVCACVLACLCLRFPLVLANKVSQSAPLSVRSVRRTCHLDLAEREGDRGGSCAPACFLLDVCARCRHGNKMWSLTRRAARHTKRSPFPPTLCLQAGTRARRVGLPLRWRCTRMPRTCLYLRTNRVSLLRVAHRRESTRSRACMA